MEKIITLNYPKSAALGFFSKGLNNEFETAMVNEPSVFERLKFYCSLTNKYENIKRHYRTREYYEKKIEKYMPFYSYMHAN